MICEEPGQVMCCENCPNVAHFECLNMTKEPSEWYCNPCLREISRKNITRSSTRRATFI